MEWVLKIWASSNVDPKEFAYSFKIAEKIIEENLEFFHKNDGIEKLREIQNL